MKVKTLFALACACSAAACTPVKSTPAQTPGVSYVDYLQIDDTFGLIGHVKQKSLAVCLEGADPSDVSTWSDHIKSVALKWVEPLRALTSDQLVRSVTVTPDGDSCDATVTVSPDVWSNTNPGDQPTVNMSDTGYFASYNVLLHEFGHAFSLADTYQNGKSGDCIPGQPQAVMCNTSFDTPQPDDIAGLTEKYEDAFPDDQPPTVPQPGGAGTSPGSVQIFAGLGNTDAQGLVPVAFSVAGTGVQADGQLAVCQGDAGACSSQSAVWTTVPSIDVRAGVTIYELAQPLALQDGLTLTVLYRTAAGQATSTLAFHGA